jgi:chromatin segregation and condensation protein Rec8/ScpA/Scc1 (kleisin family)
MSPIHQDIDTLLAADLHDELTENERQTLHRHLVECAECRQLHKEEKAMHTLLEEKFADEKPDPAFEQRVLTGFRSAVPDRDGLGKIIMGLLRLRATQITAVAALFLALVQMGRLLTHEDFRQNYDSAARSERVIVTGANSSTKEEDALAGQSQSAAAASAMLAGGGFTTGIRYRSLEAGLPLDRVKPENSSFSGGLNGNLGQFGRVLGGGKSEISSFAKSTPASAGDAPNSFALGSEHRQEGNFAGRVSSTASELKDTQKTRDNQTPQQAKVDEGPAPADLGRKVIQNAQVELEVVSFQDTAQKITDLASEGKGYVATSKSQKQSNGKLRGEVVVKMLPQNLDLFLQKVRGFGELKNQTIGSEDVTKQYLDTDARLKNARVMEERLVEVVKTNTGKVSDLLQVEKELGRVREQIEQMQGTLRFWDAQVQFATVTISLAEKDMNVPAAFLFKELAQLSLYSTDVEKIYNEIKASASSKVQITHAQLDRDSTGRVSARISVLIAPEESEAVIARIKAMGRVETFQVQTERVAQGGEGMSENARTERDKVQLNINLSREEQEQAFQQTSLRIHTGAVDEKTKALRTLTEKEDGRVRSSSFSRNPDGQEYANLALRVPMRNYNALMHSLDSLGQVENVTVQRQERTDAKIDEANAPVDISVQIYSQGNVVSQQSGLLATLRRTVAQGVSALMWSVRMIGVALAFIAPWAIALALVIWIARKINRARRSK